jgi:hypothetical protein
LAQQEKVLLSEITAFKFVKDDPKQLRSTCAMFIKLDQITQRYRELDVVDGSERIQSQLIFEPRNYDRKTQ